MVGYKTVERMADEAGVSPRELSTREYDDPEDIQVGDAWIPGAADSLVEVDDVSDDFVELRFYDRHGEGTERQLKESLLARMEADGGWHFVPLVHTDGPAHCPNCGAFMRVNGGDRRFPASGCDQCGITVGLDHLEDAGVAQPIRL